MSHNSPETQKYFITRTESRMQSFYLASVTLLASIAIHSVINPSQVTATTYLPTPVIIEKTAGSINPSGEPLFGRSIDDIMKAAGIKPLSQPTQVSPEAKKNDQQFQRIETSIDKKTGKLILNLKPYLKDMREIIDTINNIPVNNRPKGLSPEEVTAYKNSGILFYSKELTGWYLNTTAIAETLRQVRTGKLP